MDTNDRMLWMGDLEGYMDADFLSKSFARMGEEVKTVKVVFDKYSGREAGYCFLELVDGDSARRAMLNINGKVIPESKPPVTFNLSFANSPNNPYTEYNLFVNNIPDEMDDAGLFLVFGERYRSCRGAKVYRNNDSSSRGAGFVRFADQTDQQTALVEMNKFVVDGKPLYLKLAQPKFRAPRGGATARHGHARYDPINYYPQYQEYYNSQQWQMYDLQGMPPMAQPPMQMQPQMMVQPRPMMPVQMQMQVEDTRFSTQPSQPVPEAVSAPAVIVDPDTLPEPYNDECTSVDACNYIQMGHCTDLMTALDDSRWAPCTLTANTTNNTLVA